VLEIILRIVVQALIELLRALGAEGWTGNHQNVTRLQHDRDDSAT
jgi:hypothetical protein